MVRFPERTLACTKTASRVAQTETQGVPHFMSAGLGSHLPRGYLYA